MEEIKEGLSELFRKEKEIALRSNGEAHTYAINNCINLAGSLDKLRTTENNHEIGVERIIADKEMNENSEYIKHEQVQIDKDNREKRLLWDLVMFGVSTGISIVGIVVSLNWEKEGTFTSTHGRNLFSSFSKKLTNGIKL